MRIKIFDKLKIVGVLFGLISLFSFNVMHAQAKRVTGNVSDELGEPLVGVTITAKRTGKVIISDFDGNFSLKTKKGEVLTFEYLGFKKLSTVIGNEYKLSIKMIEDASILEEVVVVGYGVQEKKEVTGSVTRVEAEEIAKIATSDLGAAIQGQISGVNVVASSGEPGEESNIQIRGLSTVDGNNRPLYVVDGIPFEGDPKLSNSEIESIDVLKDAASAAIYGTRGAAGVILITTKKGEEGVMKISLDSYYGVQRITSGTPLLNREDRLYTRFVQQRALEGTVFGNTYTVVDEGPHRLTNDSNLINIIENNYAPIQNHSVNISGGKAGLSYSINGSLFQQEGVLIKSKFKRYNLRANTQYTKGKLKISTGMSSRIEDRQSPPWGLLREGIAYNPLQPALDLNKTNLDDAGNGDAAANLSRLAQRLLESNKAETHFFDMNLRAQYTVNPNLTLSTRASASYTNGGRVIVNPNYVAFQDNGQRANTAPSRVRNLSSITKKRTFENIINYNRKFGKHKFNLTGVYSAEQYTYSQFEASKFDIFDNKITVFDGTTGNSNADSGSGNRWTFNRDNTLLGALGRIQYNYDGKYLLGASIRRDGSSRFKTDRYGWFPSVSLGWNVSDEPFWSEFENVVPNFKLRASRGTTGNQNIQDYSFASTIALQQDYVFGDNEDLAIGVTQPSFANPDVKWETSISTNFGYDIGFINNKLSLAVDYYVTTNRDMLFPVQIATSNGAGSGASSTVVRNVGSMKNTGLEYALKYRHASGDFRWNAAATYTKNTNTVTELSSINKIIYLANSTISGDNNDTDLVTVLKEGFEAGAFFLHETNGIVKTEAQLTEYKKIVGDAQLGDLIYVDENKDGKIDINDRTYAGSGQPDFELGLNLNAFYKKFDLSAQLYGSFGGEVLNGNKALAYKSITHQDLVYQWSPDNKETSVPTNRGKNHANYRGHSDYWLEDGSFVRLRNIALGYTFDKNIIEKVGLSKLRVYVAAQNPLTFTKYTGYDPEVGGNGVSTRGIDRGNFPVSSQLRAGLQLQF